MGQALWKWSIHVYAKGDNTNLSLGQLMLETDVADGLLCCTCCTVIATLQEVNKQQSHSYLFN